jgi:hypothetical protein
LRRSLGVARRIVGGALRCEAAALGLLLGALLELRHRALAALLVALLALAVRRLRIGSDVFAVHVSVVSRGL